MTARRVSRIFARISTSATMSSVVLCRLSLICRLTENHTETSMKMHAKRIRLVLGSVLLGLSMMPMLANASSTDDGTLTAGSAVQSCFPSGNFNLVGFIHGTLGSYNPTGLTGGDTVWAIDDIDPVSCSASTSDFSASGFTSNPGSSWLVSVTCNSVERLGSRQ